MMQAGLGAFASSAVGAAPPMPPVPTQPGGIAPLPDPLEQLLEQSRMIKRINAKRAMEGQQAGAQTAQGMPTVREQIARALGATPYGFAGGGIVAFADGGPTDENLQGLGGIVTFRGGGHMTADNLQDLEDIVASAEAEAEWLRQQQEMMGGAEPDPDAGSTWDSVRRFITTGSSARAEKLKQEEEAARQKEAENARRVEEEARRNAAALATPGVTVPPYLAASRPTGATPAARSAVPVGATPAAPAGATPDVQPPPAARSDGLGDAFNAYRREQEALAELMRSQGATPPEVLEAQRRYDEAMAGMLKGEEDALAEMEAAAQQGMFDNPEILAGILAGMQGTDRLGETLLGAATGAARGRASQKKAVAEAKKDLNKLRRDLAMKQAELQLARKEGDVNRARTAAVEVQKIKVAIEDKAVEQRLKEMDAETRRIAADAAMTAAQQRGEARTELTPYQRSQILNDVTKEVDGNTGIKVQLARIRDAGAREQLRQQIIKERYDQAVAAAEGRTLPATSGAPATAPGAAPTLSPADRALIEKYQ